MQVLKGKSVYKGIVMGPLFVLKKNHGLVKRIEITDAEAEIARIGVASHSRVGNLFQSTQLELGV